MPRRWSVARSESVSVCRWLERYSTPIFTHRPSVVRRPPTSRKLAAPSKCSERSARVSGAPWSGARRNHWRSAVGSPRTVTAASAPPCATALPPAWTVTEPTPGAFQDTANEPSRCRVTVASVKGIRCAASGARGVCRPSPTGMPRGAVTPVTPTADTAAMNDTAIWRAASTAAAEGEFMAGPYGQK